MGSWINIAALLSAKTKEGGLSVKPTEGLPFLLTEGLEVTFVPPLLRFARSSRVERVEHPSPGKYVVYFDEVHSRSEAELLEGHFCLVRKSDLPEGYDVSNELDVTGYTVCDVARGMIGSVSGIEENPAHPLLVVARKGALDSTEQTSLDKSAALQEADGNKASLEVLIPFVDAFIEDIDENARTITVTLPDGLLDL